MPLAEAITEYPTSCGEVAWAAVGNIRQLLELFRARLAGHLSPCRAQAGLRLRPPVRQGPGDHDRRGAGLRLRGRDCAHRRRHPAAQTPSAFFGTPLVSYLINAGADTLVVTGCTTSGCVRGSVVDGFAYNFRVLVPEDAVYDRSATSHAVNLFDMAAKYAET